MNIRLLPILLFCLAATSANALTPQDEALLSAGMSCYETDDLICAKEQFENALGRQDSGMSKPQRQSIKKILYGVYFNLAQNSVNLGTFENLDEICSKGIALGVDLGWTNDYGFKSFHVWYTIALIHDVGMKDAQELAHKLKQVQQGLTTPVGDGKLSYLQPTKPVDTGSNRL